MDKKVSRELVEDELERVTGGTAPVVKEEILYCECEKPVAGFDGFCKICGRQILLPNGFAPISLRLVDQKRI